jgi:hypothetical protein
MYIIKKHYEATETNENFKGETQTWYCGKQGSDCRVDGNEGTNYLETFVKYYGYATKAGATKALKSAKELAEWETRKGYWKVTAELVEW